MDAAIVYIMPIFIVTIIGSLLKRRWLISEEFWRNLEKLMYFVLTPCVLFKNIAESTLNISPIVKLVLNLVLSVVIITLALIFYQRKVKIDNKVFTSVLQGSTRFNNYVMLSLASAMYGVEGLEIASIISGYMIICVNFISVLVYNIYLIPKVSSKYQYAIDLCKDIFSNPLIIGSLAGFIYNMMGLELNKGISLTLDNLSGAALPLGVLIVGARLRFNLNPGQFNLVSITCVNKLLILPIIVAILSYILGVNGVLRSIAMLFACVPCSTNSYMLAKQYGGDSELMASIITATTIGSLASLWFFTYILG